MLLIDSEIYNKTFDAYWDNRGSTDPEQLDRLQRLIDYDDEGEWGNDDIQPLLNLIKKLQQGS